MDPRFETSHLSITPATGARGQIDDKEEERPPTINGSLQQSKCRVNVVMRRFQSNFSRPRETVDAKKRSSCDV
jgi:hypothetical protein